MIIYPSILSDSLQTVQSQLDLVAGTVDTVQIDIVDRTFCEDITIHIPELVNVDFHELSVDIHLLTSDPILHIQDCLKISSLKTIIGQIEYMSSQELFVQECIDAGIRVGLSLNHNTSVRRIEESVKEKISLVQIMTIEAGAQGRPFDVSAVPNILEASTMSKKNEYNWEICVDGSITNETAPLCKKNGAVSCAVGSYIWKSQNPTQAIEELISI